MQHLRISIKAAVIGGMLALTFLGSLDLTAQGSNPELGTWKNDVAKSKYSPGPPPKSQTAKYEVWQDGFKLTIDAVDAKGQTTRSEVIFKYDGKEYPVPGAAQPTTITFKRIDDHTTEQVDRVNGKVTVTRRRTISRDGKTATMTMTGTSAQGQTVNTTIISTKQ